MDTVSRITSGVAGAALLAGIALVNHQAIDAVCGWALIGFAIGALLDIVLVIIASFLR